MSNVHAFIKNNVAEIELPPNVQIAVKAKANSRFMQKITLTNAAGTLDLEFSGAGDRNSIIGESSFVGGSKVTAKFEYSIETGYVPSKLNSGGPYAIGNYNLLVIVAENGDDSDYNDGILEFSWYTPKG